MRRIFLSAAIAIALVTAAAARQTAAPSIKVVPRKATDSATVSESGGKAVVAVTSPSGIGGAAITRTSERWPSPLTLRMNLRGLESIKLTAGNTNLSGAYSSHNDNNSNPVSWSLVTDGGKKETAIDRSNPSFAAIRAMNAEGRGVTGLPSQGGWFEIDVPAAILNGQSTLTVDWIDFYR